MAGLVKKALILNLILVALLAADRLTKFLILEKLPDEGVSLIPGFLNLTLYKNTNLAFGLKLPWLVLFGLIIIILFWLIILLSRAYQQKNFWLAFWLSLIIIGALSNLIDRLIYGQVIDFIEVPWWSIFNLADMMIVVGLLGWLVKSVKRKAQNAKQV